MQRDDYIPDEFTTAEVHSIRRMHSIDVPSFDFSEPVIIRDVPPFHRLETSRVVDQLRTEFGSCEVPTSDGENVLLRDWCLRENRPYIKDWHINQSCAQRGVSPIFLTPPIFRDWLSAFNSANPGIGNLDFLFLYWGDAGTSTGYHQDVVGTFSWSLNIRGRKEWKFFLRRSPSIKVIQCIQEPGEMVFVPSGCFHTVLNLEADTISINQNWFNELNICEVVEKIVGDYQTVSDEFEGFEIGFTTNEDRTRQMDIIVGSNNCLNIPILTELFLFISRSETLITEAAHRRISDSLAKLAPFVYKSNPSWKSLVEFLEKK